jgi:GMP reductase
MEQALYYHQITSIPRECVVKSRSECDTSIVFCGKKFKTPILPANMLSVINEDIAKWLSFNEYFYIYHRFSDTRKFLQRTRAESWPLVSISVGVKEEDEVLINDIAESKCRVDFITIDIANSFSNSTVKMIRHIKNNLPNTKVIAGNIWGDRSSVEFLQKAGADALKVGLSCGKSCSTFNQTSFGSPMFSAALESGQWSKIPVILDGGVREMGDIARAMIGFMDRQGEYMYGNFSGKVYPNGVNIPMVMIGSLMGACIDSPAESIYDSDYSCTIPKYKRFFGSASAENKRKSGQPIQHIEGRTVEIPCNGMKYSEYYDAFTQAIQSQISYGGGKDLSCFKDVQWRVIS